MPMLSAQSKRTIDKLSKYIVDNGGTIENCTEKRDFENLASQIRVKLLGVELFLKECNAPDLHTRENGFQGLLDLSSEYGNERGLFLFPSVVDVLTTPAEEEWVASAKIQRISYEVLRNLSACPHNLHEFGQNISAVAALVRGLKDLDFKNRDSCLRALNNLCCFKGNKLALFTAPQLVSSLVENQSRLAIRSLLFLSQDAQCRHLWPEQALACLDSGRDSEDLIIANFCILAWANLFGSKKRFEDMEILVETLVRCMDKSSSPHANGFALDDVLLAIQSVCELNENRELLLQMDDFSPMMLDGVELALRNKDVDALDLCFSIFIQFTVGVTTQDQSSFLQSSNLVQVITKTILPAHWWPDYLKKTARALRFQLLVSICCTIHLCANTQQQQSRSLEPCKETNPGLIVLCFHPEIRVQAVRVKEILRARGFGVLLPECNAEDEEGKVVFGEKWENSVKSCRAFLVLYSIAFKDCAACQVEFAYAVAHKRQMVGLMIKRFDSENIVLDRWLGKSDATIGKQNKYSCYSMSQPDSTLQQVVESMINKVNIY